MSILELARAVGASRTTIYKDLGSLEKAGLVEQENGRIMILEGKVQDRELVVES